MKTKHTLLLLVTATLCGATQASDYARLPQWYPKTRQIVVFKNGLGFVVKEGEATLKDGWLRSEALPSAVMGGMWFDTGNTNSIQEVIAYTDTETEDSEIRTPLDLLAANPSQKVTVTYNLGNTTRTVEGTLVKAPNPSSDDASLPASVSSFQPYGSPSLVSHPEENGDLILLRTTRATGQVSLLGIARNSILSVEIPGDGHMRVTRKKEVSRARIRVSGNRDTTPLSLTYLTKGLTWSPSYRIDISDEKKAQVTLDAVLVNDIEELEDTEVLFAVGFPNFLHAEIITPMTISQNIPAFIQSVANGQSSMIRSRLTEQSVFLNTANYDTGERHESSYSIGKPMAGESREDLYFYKRQNVSMKKGDRASFPVFRVSVPYDHVYQWKLAANMNVDERGYRQTSNKPEGSELQVWHVLRLRNTTQQPWTTASAFTTRDGFPIAQDTLRYTPSGGSSTLPVTVATDIRGEQSHKETARRTVTIEGRAYEEVTVESVLKVTNWKDKPAKMLVQQAIVGEIIGDVDGKVHKSAKGVAALNPSSELEWEFVVERGKQKELGYTYKVLVHR